MVPVMTISKFERFFRVAAGLDVDKKDLKRYSDFVNQKTYDLLIRGKAAASPHFHDRRPRSQESPDEALGPGVPHLRSAAVDATSPAVLAGLATGSARSRSR